MPACAASGTAGRPARPIVWTAGGRQAVLAAALLLCAGCGGMTGLRPARVFQALRPEGLEPAAYPYRDVAGVVHVHTTYSHDAHGTFEDAVRAANAQRLDFIIFTEHNNLKPLVEGRQGWHGGTLVLIGMEISSKGGHYLAMRVTQEIDYERLTTQEVIDEVARQGGFGFIAHPFFKNRPWTDVNATGFTGIEGYNVAHDTLDENRMRLAAWALTMPQDIFFYSILDRPYDPLRLWDQLIASRGPLVGIGSTDAHEFHALGMKFAPYETMFRLARTHLLVPPGELTPDAVYDALQRGHAFFSVEIEAEARGFSFLARQGGRVLGIMGDTVEFAPDMTLGVTLPAASELVLMKNGQVAARTVAQSWAIPVTEPGVYRIEASRHNKPWIFSNPIYVRAAGAQPPAAP